MPAHNVYSDNVKHGSLHLSLGAVVWYPSNTRKSYKLNWEEFDSIMQKYGARTETRSK
jgi:hypothetical protein